MNQLDAEIERLRNRISCTNLISEMELNKYERSQAEINLELYLKKETIELLQRQLDKAYLTEHTLNHQIETERRSSNDYKLKFEALKRRFEAVRNESSDPQEDNFKLKLHLETTEKEMETLKKTNVQQNVEIEAKNRQIRELESQLRCISGFETDAINQIGQLISAVSVVENLSKKLENEHNELQRALNDKQELYTELEVVSKLNLTKYQETVQALEESKKEIISLRAEMFQIQNKTDSILSKNGNEFEADIIDDLEERLKSEREYTASLSTVLDNCTQQILVLSKLETEANEKLAKLKADINENKTKHEIGTQTDDENSMQTGTENTVIEGN